MGLRTWLGLKKKRPPAESPFAAAFSHLKSFAQLEQDFWVLSETGNLRGGFFVEIGAFDGITLSNTYLLEKEFGWTGILAEPNPQFSERIRSIRSVPLCTSPVHGASGQQVTMFFVPDAPEYSAMAANAFGDLHADKRLMNEKVEQTTVSLNDLLERFDAPRKIEFMSIDTEGNEIDILSSFDVERYDVRLMCVEHNGTSAEKRIDRIMASRGYERVHREWARWDAWYRKRP